MARLCTDGTLVGPGRALAIDLLANVGHAQAQAALREALGRPAVRDSAEQPRLVQSFLLVREPDDASLDFLARSAAELEGPRRRASLSALGAAIGRAAGRDPAGAAARARALERELFEAREEVERAALLNALGNSGLVAHAGAIAGHARDPAVEVRAAAARALGGLPLDAAGAALIEQAIAGAPLDADDARLLITALRRWAEGGQRDLASPLARALAARGVAAGADAHQLAELLRALGAGG